MYNKKLEHFYHASFLKDDDIRTEEFLYDLIKKDFKDREDTQEMILVVYRRYIWHLRCFRNAQYFYKNWDERFGIFIPIYSTILTFLLSTNIIQDLLNNPILSRNILAILSLILSIVTVLNSTMAPHQKSVELSNILIKLNTWIIDFISGLVEKRDNREGDKQMNEFLKTMDDQITKLGERALATVSAKKNQNNKRDL